MREQTASEMALLWHLLNETSTSNSTLKADASLMCY